MATLAISSLHLVERLVLQLVVKVGAGVVAERIRLCCAESDHFDD